MMRYVVDTHALFWYLTADQRLGAAARGVFDQGLRGEAELIVPAIVFAELYYLNEKAGSPMPFDEAYEHLASAAQFHFMPFESNHVADFHRDAAIIEMHDRIIVGVARRLGAVLVSRDRQVTSSTAVEVVW